MRSVGLWFRRIVDNWLSNRARISGHYSITSPYYSSRSTTHYDDGLSHIPGLSSHVELLVGDQGIVVSHNGIRSHYTHDQAELALSHYNRLSETMVVETDTATDVMILEWLNENEERQATDPGYLPFDPRSGGF